MKKILLGLMLGMFMVGLASAGVTYSTTDNIITVTGYTEAVPCTFTDLYTEDKAGNITLWTGTPALNIILTTQIKPSDETALKIDFILASSGAGAGDTIDITGTDKDGSVQSETLTTTADGTFTTTKWFKTIIDIDCNGFNAGTLTVRQNQWGVIWRPTLSTFLIDAGISVGVFMGDTGYFGDTNKQIIIIGHDTKILTVFSVSNGHITFGEILDAGEKTAHNGCLIEVLSSSGVNSFINGANEINLYDCVIKTDGLPTYMSSTVGNIWQNTLGMNFDSNNDLDLYNDIFIGADYVFKGSTFYVINIVPNAKIFNCNYILDVRGQPTTIKNIYARGINTALVKYPLFSNAIVYAVNWDVDWATGFGYGIVGTQICYRQYTFNLKVIDKDGNPINNATVILKDKDGNTADQKGFETTTNASGVIAEQTVSYGYYDRTHGNTLQSYSPHNLYISVNDSIYQPYNSTFTLDDKFDQVITLEEYPFIIDGSLVINNPEHTVVIKKCALGIIGLLIIGSAFWYRKKDKGGMIGK